jgi:hypothetical protein
MANGRFVSKSISSNEQLSIVSLEADFFFQRCLPHLDVEGRITGNPQLLKGAVFPLREQITAENIPALIEELGRSTDADGRSLVVWYEVGAQRVLLFPRFMRHQTGLNKKREAPSRLPGADIATRVLVGSAGPAPAERAADAAEQTEELRTYSGPTPDEVRPKLSVSVSEVEVQEQEKVKGDAVDLEHPGARHADDATAANPAGETATASPAAQGSNSNGAGIVALPTHAWRVLVECYGIKRIVPMTDRQKQVMQDMRATLGERGALLERATYVRAWSPEHLDAMCEKILADGVQKPDAALHLVLLELRKTWLEWKAAAEKAQLGDTTTRAGGPSLSPTRIANLVSVPNNPEIAAAEAWFAAQPADWQKTIESPIDRKCPRDRAPSWRAELLRTAVVDAYRTRNSNAPEARVSA